MDYNSYHPPPAPNIPLSPLPWNPYPHALRIRQLQFHDGRGRWAWESQSSRGRPVAEAARPFPPPPLAFHSLNSMQRAGLFPTPSCMTDVTLPPMAALPSAVVVRRSQWRCGCLPTHPLLFFFFLPTSIRGCPIGFEHLRLWNRRGLSPRPFLPHYASGVAGALGVERWQAS